MFIPAQLADSSCCVVLLRRVSLQKLLQHAPLAVDKPKFTDPHTKVNALVQVRCWADGRAGGEQQQLCCGARLALSLTAAAPSGLARPHAKLLKHGRILPPPPRRRTCPAAASTPTWLPTRSAWWARPPACCSPWWTSSHPAAGSTPRWRVRWRWGEAAGELSSCSARSCGCSRC